jgi:hypothetical protein
MLKTYPSEFTDFKEIFMKAFVVILSLFASTSALAEVYCPIDEAMIVGTVVAAAKQPDGDLCVAQIAYRVFSENSACAIMQDEASVIQLDCKHAVKGRQVDGMLNRPAGSSQITLDN